ncbi:hypothetical protein [Solimicrobium silvestre]|uniref:Uncharacterized protein n=1 Tax=Solimicrobium silvestre TaxID=2099400 RepID=A0A2S9GT29_9BURK|nr:hypothetical protein [Solimicrobium silvestre]PRC90882.1 hypothetical protein S2091_4375 [Solimicrobium silvestre]
MNSISFTLRSPWPLALCLFGCVFCGALFVYGLHSPEAHSVGVAKIGVSFLLCLAGIYQFSLTCEVYESVIIVKRVFGWLGQREFKLSQLQNVLLVLNMTNKATAKLEFEDGSCVKLGWYQTNFDPAVRFLRENYPNTFRDKPESTG